MSDAARCGQGAHVSDGVAAGTARRRQRAGRSSTSSRPPASRSSSTVSRADGADAVAAALTAIADGFAGLIVTTGGTGFAPRDQTPEGTREVIERDGARARRGDAARQPAGPAVPGIAGVRGQAIICNTPGSPKGCVEQLGAILDVLPHALRLLHADADRVSVIADHSSRIMSASGRRRRRRSAGPPVPRPGPSARAAGVHRRDRRRARANSHRHDASARPPRGRAAPRARARSRRATMQARPGDRAEHAGDRSRAPARQRRRSISVSGRPRLGRRHRSRRPDARR